MALRALQPGQATEFFACFPTRAHEAEPRRWSLSLLRARSAYLKGAAGPVAASGGFVMCLDWPATPALTEIRLLVPWVD